MFSRKLAALSYPNSKNIDVEDETQFKQLIVWLEDQKIRQYLIEKRTKLKDVQSTAWHQAFKEYLKDLNYPFSSDDRIEITDWILGYAVKMEYGDNVSSYQDVSGKNVQAKRLADGKSAIQNVKDSDQQFKEAVRNLAKVLNIPLHEDDKVTLQAVILLVEERLTEKGLAAFKQKPTKNAVPLQQQELGFDTGDETLNNAARALRLLHINDLRQLQTEINDAIVSVQSLTADPKTDSRLGKVGRG